LLNAALVTLAREGPKVYADPAEPLDLCAPAVTYLPWCSLALLLPYRCL
jgi:hypothetical protein